jgi:hypothetical protein
MSMRIVREETITIRRSGQSPVNLKMTEWGAVVTKARPNGPIGRPLANVLLANKKISMDEYRATEEMYKRWYPVAYAEYHEGGWHPEGGKVAA